MKTKNILVLMIITLTITFNEAFSSVDFDPLNIDGTYSVLDQEKERLDLQRKKRKQNQEMLENETENNALAAIQRQRTKSEQILNGKSKNLFVEDENDEQNEKKYSDIEERVSNSRSSPKRPIPSSTYNDGVEKGLSDDPGYPDTEALGLQSGGREIEIVKLPPTELPKKIDEKVLQLSCNEFADRLTKEAFPLCKIESSEIKNTKVELTINKEGQVKGFENPLSLSENKKLCLSGYIVNKPSVNVGEEFTCRVLIQ